ncbi:AAA family ATPase [Thalassotalea piscium]|uniref:Cobaltochelatase CobS n=1 Tax=Thalassotalea piscium TaxID=1230533 RepID=A0A7X0NGM8_9GAMM|nr:AAA family ATPase [Thalassotalea piscium]MBB6543117.1 cobaltochelatase CobS [Thalassotalea piscium]
MNTAQNIKPITQALDYNEMIEVDASERFPEVIPQPGMKIMIHKHRHPNCIESNPHYIPHEETFRRAMVWWYAPDQALALGLVGETGTGKTELLLYMADRLNVPVYIEKITTGMRSENLEGGYELVTDVKGNNVTQKRYSKAAQGYINGGLVILDEVDKANDDLSTALHLFLEGKPWTLSVFSETHTKHPLCRIAGTANTTGEGGHERYITSNKLDSAVRARFGWLQTSYIDALQELEILENMYPQLPIVIRENIVQTANALRDALLGSDRKSQGEINCPFSTRTAVHWGYYLIAFGLERTPRDSLEFCFMGSVDEDDKGDVNSILQSIWDTDIDEPLKTFINGGNAVKK